MSTRIAENQWYEPRTLLRGKLRGIKPAPSRPPKPKAKLVLRSQTRQVFDEAEALWRRRIKFIPDNKI